MGTFRGLICNNENDFQQKEMLIHNLLYGSFGRQDVDEDGNTMELGEYTSPRYAGREDGRADLYTTEGKPILLEPERQDWIDLMPTLPLNFQDLDISIIQKDEL